ncbi:unnamed protein product [Caenorhabditis brenneri]
MTFPLLRLPFLTLQEVIKSMNVREIPVPNVQSDDMYIGEERSCSLKIGDDFFITANSSTCSNFVEFNLTKSGEEAQDEELIRDMLDYFADTYKPLVSFDFYEQIRQEFAMEVIRHCRRSHIRLFSIYFSYGKNASPEYVKEILEGGVEENGNLCIHAILPKGFEYTPPPGGFKLQSLRVSNAHWVNLNDFLQCEDVNLHGDLSHMTPAYLNNVFKTIVNTECRIMVLEFATKSFFSYSLPELIRGMRPIRDVGAVVFKGKDGRTTTIIHDSYGRISLKRE